MNLNRRRNIFTLGNNQYPDPRFQIKRQSKDLFERDPFKIQSYNFHYAERPAFPVQNLVSRPVPTSRADNSFQTYFMNYNFTPPKQERENDTSNFHENRRRKYLQESKVNINCPLHGTSSKLLNNGSTATSIHNRSYQPMGSSSNINNLQGTNCVGSNLRSNSRSRRNSYSSTLAANTMPTTSPYLRSVCNRDYLRSPSKTSTDVNTIFDRNTRSSYSTINNERLAASTSNIRATPSRFPFTSLSGARSQRSLHERRFAEDGLNNLAISRSQSVGGNLQQSVDMTSTTTGQNQSSPSPVSQTHDTPTRSGCQININIKTLDDDTDGEHFTINIETNDNCDFEENIDTNNNMNTAANNRANTLQEESIIRTYNNPTTIVTTPYSTDSMVINHRASNYSIPARVPSSEYLHAAVIKPVTPNFDQDPPKYSEIRPVPADLKKYVSKERLPAIIPVKVNNCRSCFLEERKPISQQPQQKPIIKRSAAISRSAPPTRKPKTLLETVNIPRKSCLKQTAVNKKPEDSAIKTISKSQKTNIPVSVNKSTTQHQSLRKIFESPSVSPNCIKRTQSQGCSFRRSSSPMIIHSTCELSNSPVNVNINVYTDKLKLLRV